MRRIAMILWLGVAIFANNAFSFDLEKAKSNYTGAEFQIAAIKEVLYENAPGIAVSFTVPLNRELLEEEYLSINGGEFDHWVLSDDRTKVIFPFVAPETDYSVHVSNLIVDILGQNLRFPQVAKVTTNKLVPSVNFASSAHIISSSSPKYLPVSTLNVDEITLQFFHIQLDRIPELLWSLRRNGQDSYHVLNRLNEAGELVYTGRFPLNPRKNQRTDFNIDLENIKALQPAGAYVAVMSQPGVFTYDFEHAFFMQTDIGVHVRKYQDSFDVYTQNITNGQPLKGVKVDIINQTGDIINSGESDKLGRVSFHNQSEQNHVIASKGDQLSILALNRNALDLSALKNVQTIHSQYQMFPWGPRDLYRPGELVEVNILVRDFDGLLPAAMPLTAALQNPDGSAVSSVVLQPTDTGFYHFEYQTNSNSQTGRYTLNLTFAEDNKSQYRFQVEEFLPERLDLQLFDGPIDDKRTIVSPSEIKVPVHSDYLYGAPASGNKVDGFALAAVDDHPFDNLPTFFFGDEREKLEKSRPDFPVIHLDENGSGVMTLDNLWYKVKSPVQVLVNASVYETGGRPVTRTALLTMLNTENFIGLEPQFEGRPDAQTIVDFKVGYADNEGNWQLSKDLQLKLIHMDPRWHWHHTNSRGWHWGREDDPITVFAKSLSTEAGQTTTISLPLTWGSYVLEVTDGTSTTSYKFRTAWSWWDNAISDSSRKPDQVSLGFDKTTYLPGETAKLRINPPEDGLALITVESSDEVLFTSYMEVKSEGTIVDIATDPAWSRHDLYASVMVIKPGDLKTTPVPTRAFGMVHLNVKRANTKLEVAIEAPETIESGELLSADITISSAHGFLPENARVVVALVDVGILNITRYETPDAEGYLFGARRYNIDVYDNYSEVIDNIGPKAVGQRFGGDFVSSEEELNRGGEKPKSDNEMVSFFSDPLTLDQNGHATVSFDLPDFNGRLRWMVIAYADEQFGSSDFNTKVADRVVTQIAMPRFMANGDRSTIALDLRNMSGQRQDFTLEITQSGAVENRNETQFITLDDLDKTTLRFPVVAQSSHGQGVISIHLTGSSTDPEALVDVSRTWRLGVRSAYNAITRKTSRTIKSHKKWQPNLKTNDLVPESVQLQLTISDQPPLDLAASFRYLLHYPYGCLEQATSTGFPWVLASTETLDNLGLSAQVKSKFGQAYDESFRHAQVKKAVQLVLNRLKSNGSFGLWSSDSPEDKWLTVYAADFLNEAKAMGADVSSTTLTRINKRLNKYLAGNTGTSGDNYSDDTEHYSFAVRSYAGYVLAKNSSARLSDLRRVSKKFEGKTKDDGLSWMYLAAAFKLSGDPKNAENSFEYASKQWNRKQYRYYGEYGSSVRDLTRIIELSLIHDFDGNNNLLTKLSSAVIDRRWFSTQERVSLFRLAVKLSEGQKSLWTASLNSKSGQQDLTHSGLFNSVFDLEMFNNLKSIQAGNNTVYSSVSLVGEPKKAPKPVSKEMTIKRSFYDLDGRSMLPTIMKSGELAVVELVITADSHTPDGLVVDLLPAGLEIENQNLAEASVNLAEIKIDGQPIGELVDTHKIHHVEFRDDRYVAAITVSEYGSVRLFYLVRAVTPGQYVVPGSYVEDMYRPYRHAIGKSYGTLTVTE